MKKVFVFALICVLSVFSLKSQGIFNKGDEQGLEIGKLDLKQDSIAVYDAVNGWWAESKKTLEKRMDWYADARFGCFIHWGAYSLPGGEWNDTPVRGYAEHLMRIRKIPLEEYKERVVKPFNPLEFDADEWMRNARDAGMRYFIITAKHHDGFAMFFSDAYPYDMRMTKFNRDPMKELRAAAKKYNIKFGFYYSHAFDWEHPDAPGNDWDYDNPGGDKLLHGADWWLNYPEFLPRSAKYVNEKSIPQIQELIRNYQPDIMWFDTPHKLPLYENVRILKAIRDLSPDAIVVNGRLARFSGGNLGDYINTGDRAAYFFPVKDKYWEAIPTTNESYGYSKFDLSHKSPAHFIQLLASATAKGGNILMNVGPMGNGKWDEIDVKIFRSVGDWLKVNGEAIYGNGKTGLPVQNWGVTTRKDDRLYLHIYQYPKDGKLVVGGLYADVAKAYFVANKNAVTCEKLGDKDMLLRLPAVCPDTVNTVVALQLRNINYKTDDKRLLVPDEKNILYTFDAQLSKGLSTGDGKQYRNYVQNWTRADQSMTWNVRLSQPATYRISVVYNKNSNTDAGTVIVEINGKPYKANYTSVQRSVNSENLFVAAVDLVPGEYTIVLKGERYEGKEYMRPMELVLDAESQWVSVAPDGKMVYKTTPKGDRIMDFSSAGYMGGGVAFPDVPVKKTVRPLGADADDVANIQAAIDAVADMPLENGFHGAVLLEQGTYNCSRAIRISAGGIVLRGSGSEGKNASILMMNGEGKYPAININPVGIQRNAREDTKSDNIRTTFADDYVPSGANSFNVNSADGFAVGDIIHIIRPTTAEWVKFMEMHDMVRGGNAQTWISLNRQSVHVRQIAAINGNNITLDAPLSDSYDAQYLGKDNVAVVRVAVAEPLMPLSQIGVERLCIQCPPLETDYGSAPYSGVRINGQDIWVDDLHCIETMNTIPINGRRITIRNTHVTNSNINLGASKPADFSIEGSQILIDRCSSDAGNTYWVWTNSYNTGPNVVLNSNFTGRGSRIQPHQRWATGLLVDNCCTPDGGIDFSNRGVAGSGHGWCMGWGVAWNCTAATFIIQNPPGATNWAIGCIGERQQTARYFDVEPVLPEGIFESHGAHVTPRSLYLAQLAARLGSKAVEAIGYAPGTPAALALENPVTPTPRPQPKTPVDPEFGENLAFLRPVNPSGMFRSDTSDPRKYSGEKALDGNPATYWMPGERRSNRGPSNPTFEIDTEGPLVINALVIGEPAGMTNVRAYKIEGLGGKDYTLLAEGTTIGGRKVHTFPKTTVWKVRLTILNSDGTPAISEISLYYK